MSERNDIDELFRSSLGDFEATPPASVKKAIDKALDERRKRIFPFWIWLPALLGAILTGLLLFGGQKQQEKRPSLASEKTAIRTNTKKSIESQATEDKQTTAVTAIASDERQRVQPFVAMKQQPDLKAYGATSGEKITKRNRGNQQYKQTQLFPVSKWQSGEDELLAMTDTNNPGNAFSLNESSASESKPATASDSVATADSTKTAQTIDSTEAQKPITDTIAENELAPVPARLWELSLYGGPSFGLNATGDNLGISEKGSYLLSLEINRYFGNIAVTSGLGFGQRRDEMEIQLFETKSVYAGFDSIPVYHPDIPDSILYYDTISMYESVDYQVNQRYHYAVSSFSIPIGMSWRRRFGASPFGVRAAGQVQFNFQQAKQTYYDYQSDSGDTAHSPTAINSNRLGVSANLRVHFTYDWNRFGFSAGFMGGMDFQPAIVPDGYTRKRYYFMPQLGLHMAF